MADTSVTNEVKTWAPTRKWLAAQIVAIAGILTLWATTGTWDAEETIALIAFLTQAGTTYLVPNVDTPGGVPTKTVDAEADAASSVADESNPPV